MTKMSELLISKVHSKHIWDEQPVFCFSSDIDWASEAVMGEYFNLINPMELHPILFVTHHSKHIENNFVERYIERGLHPNFMNGSSHGVTFKDVANNCIKLAPEAIGFRSHRAFDVTDITHLMQTEYNLKYVSNQITILQPHVKPILHESGLVNFPVFFEDGTHLYNKLDLEFSSYKKYFSTPGIKIISFHPMHFVFNSPTLSFMRSMKDSMSREEYNTIPEEMVAKLRNNKRGIRDTVYDIIEFVLRSNYPIISMNALYYKFMEEKHEGTRNTAAFIETSGRT